MFANNGTVTPSTTKMIAPEADPAVAAPPAPRGTLALPGKLLLVALAAGFAWFLLANFAAFAGGSDSSGYLNSARLLAHGQLTVAPRAVPGLEPGTPDWNAYAYEPLGFLYLPDRHVLTPTYPVGLPLQLIPAAWLVGWSQAAALVVILAAVGGGLLFALTAREFDLPWPWAIGGALLLCASPLYVFFSLQPMTDVVATAWTLGAIYTALRARRGSAWWGLAAGFAVGVAVLVRPTNLLLVLPVALILGLRWRAWLGLVAGGLPCAVFLGYYNLALYEEIFTTGYGEVGPLLRAAFFPHNSVHMLRWVPQLLSPLVILALPFPWLARRHRWFVALLLLWGVVFVGFYVFYYHTGETWWYLRFILPAFPPLLIAALWTGRRLMQYHRHRLWRVGLPLVALAAGLGYEVRLCRQLHVATIHASEVIYPEVADWLQAHAPADAIMMTMQTSGALFFYTSYTQVRWDMMTPESFGKLAAIARRTGRAIYAPLYPFEVDEALHQRMGGDWEKVADVHFATIWRYRPAP